MDLLGGCGGPPPPPPPPPPKKPPPPPATTTSATTTAPTPTTATASGGRPGLVGGVFLARTAATASAGVGGVVVVGPGATMLWGGHGKSLGVRRSHHGRAGGPCHPLLARENSRRMPIPLVIVCVVLMLGALGLGVYWGVVAMHIGRMMRRVPTCRDGLRLARAAELLGPEAPRVCVVVPAHNESGVVGRLGASLVGQTYPAARLGVVFCLDRCTDATAAEVRGAMRGVERTEIIEITECPPDWAGKVNAVRTGVRESALAREAEILLFTDADTEFDPECVRAAVALLLERGLGMLSLMSTLTTETWFERIVQPAAGMELLRQYPLVRANARPPEHRRAFANGQFMLFTRAAYDTVGGHEAVRSAVLEDIELARLAERRGVPGGLMFADGMLRCRMYGSYAEFVRGWKRIYIESANRRVKRLRAIGVRARVLGTVLPALALGAVGAGVWLHPDPLAVATGATGVFGMVVMLLTLVWSYRIGHTPVWCVPMYPIGAWAAGGILLGAARDLRRGVPVKWAGKEYVREAR